MADYSAQVEEVLEAGHFQFSTIKPSDWNELHRSMDSSVSRYEGRFSYAITPYTREIVDCLSPDHPARIIAVMKGSQIGFSTGVIEAGIGWIIAENPGNILFLTGHSDLSEEAMTKIDTMIDSCGIRALIRASVKRVKAMKTGDTNLKKEFPGGSLVSGSAGNHKLLRQRSVRYGFIDDFEAAKKASKESGSTFKMILQRFAAYADTMKLYLISTPELKQVSNIEPVYELGDQRKFVIPCPVCGEFIELKWSTPVHGSETDMAGITWRVDARGRLIRDSVGYVCQKCSGFFTDRDKLELLQAGFWNPTAEPSQEGFYSYHINSLYAPPGMFDWRHYVNDWIEAHPAGQNRKEDLYKAFVNLVLGETYEEQGEAPQANVLQRNIRDYEVGVLPDKLSEQDGNGKIVLLTCACDLNGVEDDARLDYEVVAWSEGGASYSIMHGSIGTFVPREGAKRIKEDRERWTYEPHRPNSVWPEFQAILDHVFATDTGRRMKILVTGVDTGHYTNHAYAFLDKSNTYVVGLKGKDVSKYIRFGIDVASFRPAKERANLFLVEVNQVKDDLAEYIRLRWDENFDEEQPPGFMNFPIPSRGLYTFTGYFAHYEAEHRVIESKDGEGIAARWVKKNSVVQNHFFDVRVYNMTLRDILTAQVCKELKLKEITWKNYVDAVLGRL